MAKCDNSQNNHKCPRCGSDDVHVDEWESVEDGCGWHFYCRDCGTVWGGSAEHKVNVRSGNRSDV